MFCIRLTTVVLLFYCFLYTPASFAQGAKQYSVNSMLVEVEAEACLGQERSRVQAEKLAVDEAKRKASEYAVTHISSVTGVENGQVIRDLVTAYSKSTVQVLKELEKGWRQSDGSGGFVDMCYHVRIRAEVVPAEMERPAPVVQASMEDPRAPLTVALWTDKDTYRPGDVMKFFFRGNKPFYAHAVYVDAKGNLVEVTPYNKARHYNGGVTYEIPGEGDSFTLMITPPLGEEMLVLYASTQPLSEYGGQMVENVFLIKGDRDLGATTRGLAVLQGKAGAAGQSKAEFAEVKADVSVK